MVAVGVGALYANTTSNYSNAVGYYALHVNTASGNNAFGYGSLGSNTSGAQNCAFGDAAMTGNKTGDNNSAFGSSALHAVDASNCTAVGSSALILNTAAGNTGVGANVLDGTTTGVENVAMGLNTGSTNKTGKGNTFLGTAADAKANNYDYSVAIGHGAISQGSNTMQLGGTGAEAVNVGVGLAAAPTARLHLPAGTATAGTAPLKLVAGTPLGTPEDGAIEYDTSHLWVTIGAVRYQLDQQAASGGTNTFGHFGALPAAGHSGNTFTADDSPTALWVDDGAAWRPIISGSSVGKRPPLASAFTALSYSAQTLTDINGALEYYTPDAGASLIFRDWSIALSDATAFVEATINSPPQVATVTAVGIHMAESSTGKMFTLGILPGFNLQPQVLLCSSAFTRSSYASIAYIDNIARHLPVFYRILRSGTNMLITASVNRVNWSTLYTIATTSVFTTAPNYIGIWGNGQNGIARCTITHFDYGSL